MSLQAFAQRVVQATSFQHFITGVILFAAILVGVETDKAMVAAHGDLLHALDRIVLAIFGAEIVLKMVALSPRPWRYFHDAWNVFDFAIVVACLLPLGSQSATVLRLLRLLRVLRLVHALPRLQVLVGTLLKSLPSMGYVGLFLVMHFYVYGVAAVFLFGAAWALDRPRRGGLLAGLAIGAMVMTRGLLPAAALLATALALPALSRPYRLVARRWLPSVLASAVLAGSAWPVALWISGPAGQAHLATWLGWNRGQLTGPGVDGLLYWARTLPWFAWPAWPMAIWAIWRWRGRLSEPAIALPLVHLAVTSFAALCATEPERVAMLPATLSLAMLAAVGLPTLRRSMVSLIDWFAVMTYSLIGIAVWAYWIAFVTGFPPKMAYRAERIAPGFEPSWLSGDVVLGMLATAAWVLLVRWRISRQPPMIWRAVVLSCGGLVLTWFLLMTLWLPAFNQRNTYRDVSLQVAAALPAGYGCIETRALGLAQRATIHYFGRLSFGSGDGACDWLLVQDDGPLARTPPSAERGWRLHWEGGRLRDPDERFRLYERLR